ncbi:hypothetical protein M758_1G053500 [Ceratodon purpureus]|nr:hypothetical protein M758_1G053500 [Ceratodon purpureus]
MAASVFNTTQVISVLTNVRNELANSSLGLNQSLVLIVLLALTPFFFLRWLSTRKLPPAPPSWPLIGHLHLLGTHAHQSMAVLSKKYAPEGIMYLKFGLKGGIIVSSPEVAKEIFKKHDLAFSQRPELIVTDLLVTNKHGVGFQQYNASWRNLRKIFTQEVLSPDRMQYAEGLRANEMDYMVNSIFKDVTRNPKEPVEVNKYFWVLTINFISRMVLSKRYFSNNPEEESEEAAEFKYVINEQFFLLGSIFPADSFPFLERFDIGGLQKRTKTLLPRFQGILTKILTERREQRKQEGDAHVDVDMVDVLLTNQEKGEITDLNIRGVVWDAFAGGTDTQIVTVEWAMAHIIADPKIYETLRSELDREVGVDRRVTESDIPRLKYLNAIMKETFRLHPPTPLLLPRETNEACTVAGYYVPPNTRLFVNVWAMGHDPEVWENPLEFRPERFLQPELQGVDVQGQHFNLIPFGFGRRICPALAIGMVGVQLGIASLVQGFDWSLPDGVTAEEMDMSEEPGINIRLEMW